MKQNKALFVLNIIIFVILILCLLWNVIIVVDIVQIKDQMANNPDADMGESLGNGIGLAVLLVFQLILAFPYGVSLIISIVSMCKKYFNWLSIANACMCGVAIALTLFVFLFV